MVSLGGLDERQTLKIVLAGYQHRDEALVCDALRLLPPGEGAEPSRLNPSLQTTLRRILVNLVASDDREALDRFLFGYMLKRHGALALARCAQPLLSLASNYSLQGQPERAEVIWAALLHFEPPRRTSGWARLLSFLEHLEVCCEDLKGGDRPFAGCIIERACAELHKSGPLPDVRLRAFAGRFSRCVRAVAVATPVQHLRALAEALGPAGTQDVDFLLLWAHSAKWSYSFEEARDLYRRALEKPDCAPSALFELAEVLEFLGDDDGAIDCLSRGLSLFSEDELFLKNPGWLTMMAGPLMRRGDVEAGWRRTLLRRDRFSLAAPGGTRLWQGERIGDGSLLLLAESGIGDEIRYASCYTDLAAYAGRIAVSADPRLVPLLSRSFPEITFVGAKRQAPKDWKRKSLRQAAFRFNRALGLELYSLATHFDYLAMAGDLPVYLRTGRAAFPRHDGYLVPDPARRAKWRQRLDGLGPGLKVGLSWRSATQSYKRDQHYFTIEQMLPILAVPGVHFVNLQYDDCEHELQRIEHAHGTAVHRWQDADLKDDIEDVAALMKELDLVIAPHTMVKELAGAVACPTLFMAPTGQAWVRWRADPATGQDVWHPSMMHVRNAQPLDKDDVIRQTRQRLAEIAAAPAESGWRAASSGLHRADQSNVEPESVQPPTVGEMPVRLTNEHGEQYESAGVALFANRREREAEWARREADFRATCAPLFDGLVQSDNPEGVLLVAGLGSYKQHALTVLGAHAAARRGWGVACLDPGPYEPGRISDPDVAHFHGLLAPAGHSRLYRNRELGDELRFEWEIDWPRRICRAEGINFYGIISNRLGKEFRKYAVDISDGKAAKRFAALLRSCDAALAVCIDAEQRLAARKLPVRITGLEQNYPPTGVFKVYCGARGYKHGIEFVEIREAYETYFRGGRWDFLGALEIQNVSRYRLYSAAGLCRDQFDDWLRRNGDDPSVVERAMGWAAQDRSGHGKPTTEGELVLERIRRHRMQGGKVACLYGCIPYDFGHPWLDEGPAHEDLRDWYNHTVETLSGTDTLLLVKPHPGEADAAQIGQPEQFFVEMLDVPTAPNVCLLGHRWLNNADLMPYMDYGIIWRSATATELALMGVPMVVCAPHAMTDYVLDFTMPKDRADYEDMLRDPARRIRLDDETKRRAAMIFEFYRSEIMIDYPFGWIPNKRRSMGPPVLSKAAFEAYLRDGHLSVDRICSHIVS